MVEWQKYLLKMFPNDQIVVINNSPYIEVQKLDTPISYDEIKMTIKNCKNNKSPGPDLVSYEFLKNLPDYAIICLKNIFNKFLLEEKISEDSAKIFLKMIHKKGDKNDPGNYRPIALANCILKIYGLILNNRLNEFVEEKNILPEFQSGFRKKRSTVDNIFTLSSIIQIRLKEKKSKMFALFVDFKEAFPSINHQILWQKLSKLGVSTKFINILKDIYNKAAVAVKNSMGATDYIKLSKGLL